MSALNQIPDVESGQHSPTPHPVNEPGWNQENGIKETHVKYGQVAPYTVTVSSEKIDRMESDWSISAFRYQNSITLAVKEATIEEDDKGKGYEDWLKISHLKPEQYLQVIPLHGLKQLACMFALAIPAGILAYAFSLLVEEAAKQWKNVGVAPMQDNPVLAGLIGEPFHELSSATLWTTFIVLQVLCPILCCQTKMFGHLYLMFGGKVMPVLKTSITVGSVMFCGNLIAPIIMHSAGVHVPRIAWMGVIFVTLFAGLFLCAKQASQLLDFKPLLFLYFRASFVANVLLYLYAVFFPFWFFGTDSLAAKTALAVIFHPVVEFIVYFLFQHSAVFYLKNDPKTSCYMAFHYCTLFALYGSFLLVNFPKQWQNVTGFALLRLWGIITKVFAQEITFSVYRYVLRYDFHQACGMLKTLRFKRFRNDMINNALIIESGCILMAGAITYLYKFDKATKDAETHETQELSNVVSTVALQISIGLLCDFVGDGLLAKRRTPWHSAWETRHPRMVIHMTWIFTVSVGMFLFYFYPFLASRMLVGHSFK